jgi:metallo-beta-lactamase family protein
MLIQFIGAAREVTGSCFLMQVAGARFLVDCGMFQGVRDSAQRNRRAWPFDPRAIDFVILTHAHIDHSGLLPRLVAHGFRGPIYSTPASVDLCEVMLADSAYIQESDWTRAERRARGRRRTEDNFPLYTVAQAAACQAQMRPVEYDVKHSAQAGIRFTLRDAVHILGSAIVELEVDEGGRTRRVCFSGDLGQPGRPLVRDPTPIAEADVLVVESTYGNRLHKDLAATTEELVAAINETFAERRGNIVVPAFALGRTQELIYLLTRLARAGRLPPMQVFVDSPLAAKCTAITLRHMTLLDDDTREMLAAPGNERGGLRIKFTTSVDESMAINRITSGALIIAASGMCDAGRIRHHLRYNLGRAECAVIMVGYQANGTLGRRLVDHAARVRIFGDDIKVRARIHTIGGLSAHADRGALMAWLRGFDRPPARTFVVHGEEETATGFAASIARELGWPEVTAPVPGACVEL